MRLRRNIPVVFGIYFSHYDRIMRGGGANRTPDKMHPAGSTIVGNYTFMAHFSSLINTE